MADFTEATAEKVESALQQSVTAVLQSIDDPTSKEKRKLIYQREPYTAADNFDGWPYVILENYGISTEKLTVNGDLAQVEAEIELQIDGRDTERDSKLYHDNLADSIIYAFKTSQRQNLEQDAKIYRPEIENDDRTTAAVDDGKPVIRRNMTISFRFKVRFSE